MLLRSSPIPATRALRRELLKRNCLIGPSLTRNVHTFLGPLPEPANLQSVTGKNVGRQFPLVVVSNRLPVAWKKDLTGNPQPFLSPGGLVTALGPAIAGKNVAWVGWSGEETAPETPLEFEGMTLYPVSLEPGLVAGHYEGFSNRTLWPLFHDVGVPAAYNSEWWNSYVQVNHRFVDRVDEVVEKNGVVWVHDYQLMTAPELLRAKRPDITIGYFHHIPFPPPTAFAEGSRGFELVSGLLGADVVGFQRSSDVRNFCDAVTEWGLGEAVDEHTVSVAGRLLTVAAFPISLDFAAIAEAAASDVVRQKAAEFRHSLGEPLTVFLGVDRIDYTKGIPERLRAYRALLDSKRLLVEDTVFVQAGSPSRETLEEYRELAEEIASLVDDINQRHGALDGRPAVHYIAENLSREDMLALFVSADVMVVSSLRDGMNLVAKEFVACRNSDTGVLVLSVHTGAADHMPEALLVDPTDQEQLAAAMLSAAKLGPVESTQRMRALRDQVRVNDVARWSKDFLKTLGTVQRRGG
jgi:alpha,alpha-trehalose-phosphate synthase [UDP-forming]